MKVSRKIASGYAILAGLVIACGIVGWSVLGRMTHMIEFVTGPAWDTADGCMEFTIQLQTQVLATDKLVAGFEPEASRQALDEAREGTTSSLVQMLQHQLLPAATGGELKSALERYSAAQAGLLSAHESLQATRRTAELRERDLERLAELARTLPPAATAESETPRPAPARAGSTPAVPVSQTKSVTNSAVAAKGASPAPNTTQHAAAAVAVAPAEPLAQSLVSLTELRLTDDIAATRAKLERTLAEERARCEKVLGGPHGARLVPEGAYSSQSLHDAYRSALDAWEKSAVALLDARQAYDTANLDHQQSATAVLDLMPAIEERTDGVLDEMVPRVAQTKFVSRAAILTTIGVSLLVAIAASVLITRSIMRPMKAVIAGLKDIAEGEGDLTRRLDDTRNDELAELARWFNVFVGKLQGIVQRLAGNSAALAQSSCEVSEASTELAGVADETKQRSATVAAAAEEMAVNMKHMADTTGEMSQNVRTVASAVEELHITIGEVAKSAERAHSVAGHAAELADSSNTMIAELGRAADGIGKVIQVIEEIAEQTSLLALNATIEAARAGDAGKGFAVVATEVKELARQTATATEDIRARIEGIQTSSRQAIEAIGSISAVIRDVNEVSRTIASAVEEQSIATREISHSVAQTAAAAESVSQGVAQSAAASDEITQSITGVDAAARRAAGGASKTQAAGNQLRELSQQINNLVAQFQV